MKYEADADGKILWIECVICGSRMVDKGGEKSSNRLLRWHMREAPAFDGK